MIRKALASDVYGCGELAKAYFFKKNQVGMFIPEVFVDFWTKAIAAGYGAIFIRESAGIVMEAMGIVFHPSPYNGLKAAGSMFWYCLEEQHGLAEGSLFSHVNKSLDEMKIVERRIPALFDKNMAKVQTFLLRTGFRPEQITYVREDY